MEVETEANVYEPFVCKTIRSETTEVDKEMNVSEIG